MRTRVLPLNTAAVMAMAIVVTAATAGASAQETAAANIVRAPTDIPAPIGDRGPETVQIDLETVELVGNLADGTTYRYWTFGGKVPGPLLRVRVGDTVEVRLTNHEDSWIAHNVDFHAVTGLHGGEIPLYSRARGSPQGSCASCGNRVSI